MNGLKKHIIYAVALALCAGLLQLTALASIGYNAFPALTHEQAKIAAASAKASGSGAVTFSNITETDKEVMSGIFNTSQGTSVRFRHMEGGDVKFQLEFDESHMPSFPDNISLTVHENPRASQQVFTHFFSGRIESYRFPDVGSPYQICFRTRLNNPGYYIYDPVSYTYYRLGSDSVYTDKNGYTHIVYAKGYLIVSNGPLQLKPAYR